MFYANPFFLSFTSSFCSSESSKLLPHCAVSRLGKGLTADYVGVVDASSFGVGGVIIGKLSPCRPTVFQHQWPPDIMASEVLHKNRGGKITNLDLEIAGLLLLWLMIKHVCTTLTEKRVALFSDNEKIRPWARGLRVMRLKTIGRGRGGHPWWAQPLFVMIK